MTTSFRASKTTHITVLPKVAGSSSVPGVDLKLPVNQLLRDAMVLYVEKTWTAKCFSEEHTLSTGTPTGYNPSLKHLQKRMQDPCIAHYVHYNARDI